MTEEIRYTLLDPTGNITLLVESPVPPDAQPALAGKLMTLEPRTEQVGFVSFDTEGVRLRMAGGEFCGNASMCAAALYMERTAASGTVPVCVSGTAEPVSVAVAAAQGGERRCVVSMPPPLSVDRVRLSGELLPVVRFSGIVHVILERGMDRDSAERLASQWCRLLAADALGLMFFDRAKGTLTPLVYVPEADTLCWETSCASGTTAVGVFLASESCRAVDCTLTQPGGTLEIAAVPNGPLSLTGSVRIMKRAFANV